jgi:hypothetical protein
VSWKLSRTVLKPSRSGDASAQGNEMIAVCAGRKFSICQIFRLIHRRPQAQKSLGKRSANCPVCVHPSLAHLSPSGRTIHPPWFLLIVLIWKHRKLESLRCSSQ